MVTRSPGLGSALVWCGLSLHVSATTFSKAVLLENYIHEAEGLSECKNLESYQGDNTPHALSFEVLNCTTSPSPLLACRFGCVSVCKLESSFLFSKHCVNEQPMTLSNNYMILCQASFHFGPYLWSWRQGSSKVHKDLLVHIYPQQVKTELFWPPIHHFLTTTPQLCSHLS